MTRDITEKKHVLKPLLNEIIWYRQKSFMLRMMRSDYCPWHQNCQINLYVGYFQKCRILKLKNLLKVTHSNNPPHKQIKTKSTLRTSY